jgi:hypothetical protein
LRGKDGFIMADPRLSARLREKIDSGRRTPGGGDASINGVVTAWGGEKIMVYRNPDGPAAADALDAASAREAVLREALEEIEDMTMAKRLPLTRMVNDTASKALGEGV